MLSRSGGIRSIKRTCFWIIFMAGQRIMIWKVQYGSVRIRITLMWIRIDRLTSMRIRILLLAKVVRIWDHWKTKPPGPLCEAKNGLDPDLDHWRLKNWNKLNFAEKNFTLCKTRKRLYTGQESAQSPWTIPKNSKAPDKENIIVVYRQFGIVLMPIRIRLSFLMLIQNRIRIKILTDKYKIAVLRIRIGRIRTFWTPGYGSRCIRYQYGSGSNSGSFYNQAKIVGNTLIPTVLWLLFDFLSLKKLFKCSFKK